MQRRVQRGSGFTLIDILVSIAVIALLIGIMLPSLSQVREMSRRVLCASNVRQIGFGLLMYADANKDFLAPTIHVRGASNDNSSLSARGDTMTIRVDADTVGLWGQPWDGIGRLYLGEYLRAPKIFYCPSHRGEHPFSRYELEWAGGAGEIVSNYQYRGKGARQNQTRLTRIIPPRVALLTDGMRTIDDFNHAPGMNVLFADLSVAYLIDTTGSVTSLLPQMARVGGGANGGGTNFDDVWNGIDKLGN